MELLLNKDYKIISDTRQYILCKYTINKKGEVRWRYQSYFMSLASALKSVPDTILRESDANGWQECLEVLQDIRNIIKEGISHEH